MKHLDRWRVRARSANNDNDGEGSNASDSALGFLYPKGRKRINDLVGDHTPNRVYKE